MDLKAFDTRTLSNEGVWIDIIDPTTQKPSGLQWKVAGIDSDLFADFSKRVAANGKLKKAMDGEQDEFDYDVEMLAELSLSWRDVKEKDLAEGTIIYGGEELGFSKENAKRVIHEIPIVRRQVNRQILREQNFLAGRSKG